MNDAVVKVQLDRDDPVYQPDETLSVRYQFLSEKKRNVEAVEVSVLWYTEGKGDEDLGVHHFERLVFAKDGRLDARREQRFSTRLPKSPLSYDGVMIKVRWCVRVRVFLAGGDEHLGEAAFQLGKVARAQEVTP